MIKVQLILFCLILLLSFSAIPESRKDDMMIPIIRENQMNQVQIIAHRGAWKKNGLPQNSIASLRNAIELGVYGSEFDVRISADDSLVINHDSNYSGKPIENSYYAELIKVRLSNGEKLPTLREYLNVWLKETKSTRLVCELKSSGQGKERNISLADKSVELARSMDLAEKIVWISFDYNIVKRISELEPEAVVFYLNGDMAPAGLKEAGIKGAGYNFAIFKKKPEWIEESKKYGIFLNVWTVNNPDDMKWFISMGFDFITTDEPELLAELLKKEKGR